MMLEQEMAGIVRAILETNQKLTPYYDKIPDDFQTPAVFFPCADINTAPYTIDSYAMEYSWYIKFFAERKHEAYENALHAMRNILKKKKIIPLVDISGMETGEVIRLKDMVMSGLEEDAYQLTVEWEAIRPYKEDNALRMQEFHMDFVSGEQN